MNSHFSCNHCNNIFEHTHDARGRLVGLMQTKHYVPREVKSPRPTECNKCINLEIECNKSRHSYTKLLEENEKVVDWFNNSLAKQKECYEQMLTDSMNIIHGMEQNELTEKERHQKEIETYTLLIAKYEKIIEIQSKSDVKFKPNEH